MNYKGQLKGFPKEVVEKMLDRQEEQTGVREVEEFEDFLISGFVWNKTIEGSDFWWAVILNRDFDLFFEKYPKEDKWISVEDRLPEDEEDKLILLIGWDDMLFQRVALHNDSDKNWYGWDSTKYNTVTHWQPLPEPPKKKE